MLIEVLRTMFELVGLFALILYGIKTMSYLRATRSKVLTEYEDYHQRNKPLFIRIYPTTYEQEALHDINNNAIIDVGELRPGISFIIVDKTKLDIKQKTRLI